MKRIMIIAAIVGIIGLLATATVVVAWGGVRALKNNQAVTEVATERQPRSLGEYARGGDTQGEYARGADARGADARGTRGVDSGSSEPSERRYPQSGNETHDWLVIKGTVIVGTEAGSDIVIETASGEHAEVGTGPGWLATQGFELQKGEVVTIRGFWEDGEFKAGEIVRERDQERIVLRDEAGHPAWAGSGRRASAGERSGAQAQGRDAGEQDGEGYKRGGAGQRGGHGSDDHDGDHDCESTQSGDAQLSTEGGRGGRGNR
jgi:hypothetical protein